jgi:uncharacterized protein (DUF58 family)
MSSQTLGAASSAVDEGRGLTPWQIIERLIGITIAGVIVAVLAVVGWVVARSYGGRGLYLLAYAGVILLAVAVALARRRRPVTAQRSSIARRARVGQTLNVELTLSSRSRVTAFRIDEKLHPHLGRTVVVPISSLSPAQELKHRYSVAPKLRGVFQIGPLTAEFTDPIGLAKRRQELLPASEIIVHPNVEHVLDRPLTRAFEEPPLRPPRSRPWPDGFEFYGMRDYVRGDDVRRVVWSAYARTEKLMVREFEQGISDRITIVVDTDHEWNSPGSPSETFETAVRVAASVGVKHIKDGFTVQLESCYGSLGGFRGPRARLPFLDELARIHLSKEPLSNAMDRLAKARRRDSHVVLITGHFDSSSVARANLLANSGSSFTVCAVVWEESDPVSIRRAYEIGAQVVQVKPGVSLSGVFRASLLSNVRARS